MRESEKQNLSNTFVCWVSCLTTGPHSHIPAEQEQSRVALEVKKLKDGITEITDSIQTNQTAIAKYNEKVAALKEELKWNEQELSAWIDKTKSADEDANVIAKYTRSDEAKIKQLTLEIDKLTQDAAKAQRELEAEVTETHANQMSLDKAADDFRQLHAERKQLLRLWEQTVEQMQKRDSEIEAAAQNFQHFKGVVAEKVRYSQEFLSLLF
jgi:chromosome segregation ATPase